MVPSNIVRSAGRHYARVVLSSIGAADECHQDMRGVRQEVRHSLQC